MGGKKTVFIIKSSSWSSSHLSRNHPEYSAIINLVNRYKSKFRFVLVGSSKSSIHRVKLLEGVDAWDIPKRGTMGFLSYNIRILALLLYYRTDVAIVLGLQKILPVALYSLIMPIFKYIPIFIGEFRYYGNKNIERTLFPLFFKVLGMFLGFSNIKIANMFTLSRYTRDNIRKIAPRLRGKIELISYPIHSIFHQTIDSIRSEQFFRNKTKLNVNKSVPTILTVAGIEYRKGLDILIKAVSLVPKNIHLVVKGDIRESSYMVFLQNMINDLNLNNRVTFITKGVDYDTLVFYYNSATLFVLPTREDCLGVVILEALHCKLPVIAPSVGGIPDMIEDGVNGILFQPNNPIELAKAISLLINNSSLRRKLSTNTKQSLETRYYAGRISLAEALKKSIENA